MTRQELDDWVQKLGQAWIALNTDAALALVDKDAVEWYESPFDKPLTSWQSVYGTWKTDLSKQRDVTFSHEVLACEPNQGVVRWQATFTRISDEKNVELDGIFLVSLNENDLCTKFIMWAENK